jgi:hypothetical protein
MKNNNILLIAILSLICASCEQDNGLENKEVSGKDVPVRIRSMSVSEGSSENLNRSSSQQELEMVTTPVGDGMLLEMSIKEDESPLRAVLLGNGKKFRVIAVNHGTSNYYSHGDFTVGVSDPANDFHVKIGQKYDYICISYNSDTDLPPSTGYTVGTALSTSFTVDNSKDLLWCRINKNENVPSPGVDLEILLVQMLAKVTVILDCTYNGWGIKSVAASKVGITGIPLTCSMNWSDGTLTGTATEQWLTFATPASPYPKTLSSNALRIIPSSSNATIKFLASAVSRDGYAAVVPTSEKSILFTTALNAGVNYTITIRLRTPIWAKSNIYWDATAQKLTFVPISGNTGKEGYQGVLFKWGSLVGVSPAQTGGSNSFLDSTPVYKPNGSGGWISSTYNTWDEIPYLDSSYSGPGTVAWGRDNQYAMDADQNTATMYQGFRGDICQYIGATATENDLKGYRLPTSNELGPSSGWVNNIPYQTLNSSSNPEGTIDIVVLTNTRGRLVNNDMGLVVFPASGYRNNGTLGGVGGNGAYLNGSLNDAAEAGILNFFGTHLYLDGFRVRGEGLSVRCVKK